MKLSIAKSVGKKIIFVAICPVLLLIFTALSYGGFDPRYTRLLEHPEQELLSPQCPPQGDYFEDALLVVVPNWNGFFLLIGIKAVSPKENPNPQRLITQELKNKSNKIEKIR